MAIGVARAALDLAQQLLAAEGVDDQRSTARQANLSAVEAELCQDGSGLAGGQIAGTKSGLDGGQQTAQLHGGIHVQGEGRTHGQLRHTCAVSSSAKAWAIAKTNLLEKFARDSKILDIFEGTQQIQQLIVARRLLGKSSSELK